jgi:3-oxoacyl-(acyl-carrier-protein) synthase
MVFATKGELGHSLAATGAIEAVATVLALRDGRAPPIQGLLRPLPELSQPFPRSDANRLAAGPGRRLGASVTIGFGGFNTCLLVSLDDDPDEAPGAASPPDAPATVRRHALRPAAPQRGHRNSPSLFADPLAWLVADAVAALLEGSAAVRDETGIIVCSETATTETMRSLAASVPSGRLSPMRFAGANPGVVAGLSCIRLGLRGPSLVLTMPPDTGRAVAALMATGWIRDGCASAVVLVEHLVRDGGDHVEATLMASDVSARGGGRAA